MPQLGDECRFESLKSLAATRRRALDCARGVLRTDVDDDGLWGSVERSKHEVPRNTPVVWGNDFALIPPRLTSTSSALVAWYTLTNPNV